MSSSLRGRVLVDEEDGLDGFAEDAGVATGMVALGAATMDTTTQAATKQTQKML